MSYLIIEIRKYIAWEFLYLAVRILPQPDKGELASQLVLIAKRNVEEITNRVLARHSRLN